MDISIAFIPDGTRRFAKQNCLDFSQAYELGCKKAEEVMSWCLQNNKINSATIFALSNENFQKRNNEFLNALFTKYLRRLRSNPILYEHKVYVKVINTVPLPKIVEKEAIALGKDTQNNKGGRSLYICLAYGGQQHISQCIQTNKTFEIPDIDLLIRTGGNHRLSNFCLYQLAYTELYFTKKLWCEFTKPDLQKALNWYSLQHRNFGK